MSVLHHVCTDRPVAVIGDIHGRSDLLAMLTHQVGDRLYISVGDVVDRGEDVYGCIDQLVAIGAIGILGNHEEWVRKWMRGEGFESYAFHPSMGGVATLRSYGVFSREPKQIEASLGKVPASHRAWFESLVEGIDLEVCGQKYWVLHSAPDITDLDGGEEAARALFESEMSRLRWGRYIVSRVPDCGRPVIAGHMIRQFPAMSPNVIAIDTGSGTIPSGALTAFLLPERRFVTVP